MNNEFDYFRFENRPGYKWENGVFKNLIANSGMSGDRFVLQIDKSTGKEEIAAGKREFVWGPLTAIIVKYCGLANIEILKKFDKPHPSCGDTETIEDFLSQNLYFWDKIADMSDYRLNNPFEECISFTEKSTTEKNTELRLHFKKYEKNSKISILWALKNLEERKKAFIDGIIYFPCDCEDLLKALTEMSPYKGETEYAVARVLRNPGFFLGRLVISIELDKAHANQI